MARHQDCRNHWKLPYLTNLSDRCSYKGTEAIIRDHCNGSVKGFFAKVSPEGKARFRCQYGRSDSTGARKTVNLGLSTLGEGVSASSERERANEAMREGKKSRYPARSHSAKHGSRIATRSRRFRTSL